MEIVQDTYFIIFKSLHKLYIILNSATKSDKTIFKLQKINNTQLILKIISVECIINNNF